MAFLIIHLPFLPSKLSSINVERKKSDGSKLEDSKETCWKLIEKKLKQRNTYELELKVTNVSVIRWKFLQSY